MRKAQVFFDKWPAGILTEEDNGRYVFEYAKDYTGPSISKTMPREKNNWGLTPLMESRNGQAT